jgi:predicted transcriptional regulator
MTDFKVIEQKAYKNIPLPNYPSQAEQFAYLSMRALFNDFRKGNIKKDQAQLERSQVQKAYDNVSDRERKNIEYFRQIDRVRIALAGYSKEVEAGTCERCKQMMRIFDGRTL